MDSFVAISDMTRTSEEVEEKKNNQVDFEYRSEREFAIFFPSFFYVLTIVNVQNAHIRNDHYQHRVHSHRPTNHGISIPITKIGCNIIPRNNNCTKHRAVAISTLLRIPKLSPRYAIRSSGSADNNSMGVLTWTTPPAPLGLLLLISPAC